jgi:hypothetical protein
MITVAGPPRDHNEWRAAASKCRASPAARATSSSPTRARTSPRTTYTHSSPAWAAVRSDPSAGAPWPLAASTLLGVEALGLPGWLIEVEATALLPPAKVSPGVD